jgi:hypothetical protein
MLLLLYPRKKTGTHCIGGSGSPREDLDIMHKTKISRDYRESNVDSSDVQSVAKSLYRLQQLYEISFAIGQLRIQNKSGICRKMSSEYISLPDISHHIAS